MAGEGFLGRECPWEPRGRVRATLKLLQDRERGEGEIQICSNGRTEELCEAVIEAWEKVAPLERLIRELTEEVCAWRKVDDCPIGAVHAHNFTLKDARRLRAQNERKEEPR